MRSTLKSPASRAAVWVLILVWLFTGCKRSEPPTPPKTAAAVAVRVTKVGKGEATRSITLPGEVFAYQQATLYAKVAGYAKTVSVDKGDAVQQGALLAEIEVPELVADLAKYRAELEFAALDYKRVREAQAKAADLVVPQSVDIAKSKADIAKANLERTETLLGFAKITAPFSGIITKRMIDPGAFVPSASSGGALPNAALFTLMDFSKVRVQASIPELEVPFIKNGLESKVTVEELPGTIYDGQVSRFSHALDQATKTMLAEIELPNPKGDLRPGMYALVRIVVERKPDVLVIPSEALVVERTGNAAFTIADGKARRRALKIGFNDQGRVEITEGLQPGDSVILLGKQPLTDGQSITVSEAK